MVGWGGVLGEVVAGRSRAGWVGVTHTDDGPMEARLSERSEGVGDAERQRDEEH